MSGPDSLMALHLRQVKAQLLAREGAQFADLARRWAEVERAIDAQLVALAQDIHDRGGLVSRDKLQRLERYRALREQARREVRKYVSYADDSIGAEQAHWARLGLDSAAEAIQLGYYEAGRAIPAFDRLPVDAVNDMIGYAADGSPLKELLRQTYPDAVEGLTGKLISAVATGQGAAETARAMRDGFGMGLQRAMVIARTEQNRAYRTATAEQYRASGLVKMQRRISAHRARTCIACLADEGKLYPLDAPIHDHPRGACSSLPVLIGVDEEPFETGEDWLKTLAPDGQRAILGDKRYELWQSGRVKFEQFVKHTHDATWGASLTPRPVSELPAAG